LFISNNKKLWRAKESIRIFKDDLLIEAVEIGILFEQDFNDTQLCDFTWWLAMSKLTQMTKSIFDYSNSSIGLLDEIFYRYSYKKLTKMFKDDNIMRIFKFFLWNGLTDFLKSVPENDKDVYSIAVKDLCVEFGFDF